jgi:heat shock protein HtpX
MNNTLKTILLFSSLVLILITLGKIAGDSSGALLFGGIGILMNIFVYFFSDKIAIRTAKAKPMAEDKFPEVYRLVKELSGKAGVPCPKLFLSDSLQANAFATGRNPSHSSVVVTMGLLNNLEEGELAGVLAHEIGHIKNRDILLATAAAVIASAITSLVYLIRWTSFFGGRSSGENRNPFSEILIIILAPIAALLIQMAISRSREFKADATGAKLAGDGEGLASALAKLANISQREKMEINPAFENLYIVSPLAGGASLGLIQRLFATHPPVAERIERLEKGE